MTKYIPIIRYWSDINFTVVHIPDEYSQKTMEYDPVSADFNVYRMEGRDENDAPLYWRAGAISSLDDTKDWKEADKFLEVTIKWDGCSHWNPAEYWHMCGKGDAIETSTLFIRLYEWAKEFGMDRLDDQTQP